MDTVRHAINQVRMRVIRVLCLYVLFVSVLTCSNLNAHTHTHTHARTQAMYEKMRSERNFYNKNWIESQDEINEQKRRFKLMEHQINQLKEEIAAKNKGIHTHTHARTYVGRQREEERDVNKQRDCSS